MVPTAEDFERCLKEMLHNAQKEDESSIDISGGTLHRKVGGYPGNSHRMPMACAALRRASQAGDIELPNNLKKDGASFTMRFKLPRH